MELLQVGVIGTGAIGKTHIARLTHQVTGARVVAVSDIDQQAAREVAQQYGAKCYEKGEDLILDPDVQAVVVCSWDPTHEQYVLAAIDAGKFVFCEKPLAETAESCKRIVEKEMACGRHLVQVGFMRRFDRDYRAMKAALDSGALGAPLMAHCVHRNATSNAQYETKVNVTGTAIHEIDVMRWLLSDDIVAAKIVQPRVSKYVKNGQMDPQIIVFQTRSGAIIDVETFLHCQYGYDVQCEVVAEEGTIRLPDPAQIVRRQKGACSFEILEDWRYRFEDAYNIEFQSWVDHTKQGVVAGPTAWDGYAAIAVAEACLQSRETGNWETVQMERTPDFYGLD